MAFPTRRLRPVPRALFPPKKRLGSFSPRAILWLVAFLVGFATCGINTPLSDETILFSSLSSQETNNDQLQIHLHPSQSDQAAIYSSSPTPTILCIIPFVWNQQAQEKRSEIMDTWGKRCTAVRFLIDPWIQTPNGTIVHANALSSLPSDTIILSNMTRSWHTCSNNEETATKKKKRRRQPTECRHIWEKIWRSIVWIHDYESGLYDYYVKADWDTYLFPENILWYMATQQTDPVKITNPRRQHYYTGHVDFHLVPFLPFVSGAAQVMSHATFHGLAHVLKDVNYHGHSIAPLPDVPSARGPPCQDAAGLADFPTAYCLRAALNVSASIARNTEYQGEYVLLVPPNFLLSYNRTDQGEWWYWKNKPWSVGDMEQCCAERPWAFHGHQYKPVGNFYAIEQAIYGGYGDNDHDDEDGDHERKRQEQEQQLAEHQDTILKTKAVSEAYFARVRNAMGIVSTS